jgi:hypothetical protein
VEAIESLGYNVVPMPESAVTPARAAAAKAIVISSSVLPNEVPGFLASSPTPILSSEVFAARKLQMAQRAREVRSQTSLSIVGSGSGIGDNLSGMVRVTDSPSRFGTARPGGDAQVIATRVGSSNDAAIYSYDTGDAMVGRVAPARRVGFFYSWPTPLVANDVADELLVDSLSWLVES